jgi:hypothetical protein
MSIGCRRAAQANGHEKALLPKMPAWRRYRRLAWAEVEFAGVDGGAAGGTRSTGGASNNQGLKGEGFWPDEAILPAAPLYAG